MLINLRAHNQNEEEIWDIIKRFATTEEYVKKQGLRAVKFMELMGIWSVSFYPLTVMLEQINGVRH